MKLIALVWESIAYPDMDFRKYSVIHPWFLDLQFSIQVWISKQGYPWKDNLQLISMEHNYPCMDIHVFVDISLQLSMLLWISMRVSMLYGYLGIYGFLWISMHGLAKGSRSRVCLMPCSSVFDGRWNTRDGQWLLQCCYWGWIRP